MNFIGPVLALRLVWRALVAAPGLLLFGLALGWMTSLVGVLVVVEAPAAELIRQNFQLAAGIWLLILLISSAVKTAAIAQVSYIIRSISRRPQTNGNIASWKQSVTVENIERLAGIGLVVSLASLVVYWFINHASGWASGQTLLYHSAILLGLGAAAVVSLWGLLAAFYVVTFNLTVKKALWLADDLMANRWQSILLVIVPLSLLYAVLWFALVTGFNELTAVGFSGGAGKWWLAAALWICTSLLNGIYFYAVYAAFLFWVAPEESKQPPATAPESADAAV